MSNSTKLSMTNSREVGNYFSIEVDAWLRELDFLANEVAFMKTWLALVVELISAEPTLDEAETNQNKLLDLDAALKLVKEKVKKHKETVKLNLVTLHPANDKKNAVNHNKIRKEVLKIEKDYMSVKNQFNNFVSKIYEPTVS